MRTKHIGVIGLTVLAVALGGCSPSDGGGASTGTVTLWHLDDQEDFVAALKEGFEKEYPGLTLEPTEIPEDGYVTKVDTALLASQPPDVAFMYEARWMKAGSVLPLDDVIAEHDIDVDSMNSTALDECRLDGKLYCLGSLTGSVVLMYNKDVFDAAGVAYPSTTEAMSIDELAEIIRAVGKPSSNPSERVWGAMVEAPFVWSGRSTHFSEDGRSIEGFVDDDATVHMYDVLAGLMKDELVPTPEQAGLGSAADLLASGQAAMAITDMEVAARSLDAAGHRWGAAPPPVERTGDTPFVFVGTDKYSVFSKARNLDGAKKLVAYIGAEGSRIRAQITDNPPLDESLMSTWVGDNESRQEVMDVMSIPGEKSFFVAGFWEVTAPLMDAYAQLGNGIGTASDTLTSLAPSLQDKLDTQWKTWDGIK